MTKQTKETKLIILFIHTILLHSEISSTLTKLPDMSSLPLERIIKTKLFKNIGLDYIGSVKVRINNETVKT